MLIQVVPHLNKLQVCDWVNCLWQANHFLGLGQPQQSSATISKECAPYHMYPRQWIQPWKLALSRRSKNNCVEQYGSHMFMLISRRSFCHEAFLTLDWPVACPSGWLSQVATHSHEASDEKTESLRFFIIVCSYAFMNQEHTNEL